MAGSGRSRRRYEVRRIRYPDEGYDVRRNVGIPACRFRYGYYSAAQMRQLSGATLLLCAFVGVAIALYDYQITQTKIKQNAGAGAGYVGGDSDGI